MIAALVAGVGPVIVALVAALGALVAELVLVELLDRGCEEG